jgi:peptide/nickel transport system substrate-binding protein
MDPSLDSPVADSFEGAKGKIVCREESPQSVSLVLPAPIAGFERLLDGVAIVSSHAQGAPVQNQPAAVLGPFVLAEHRAGAYLVLARNPHYWKKDEQGRTLPYLDSIRLEIQRNRDLELIRFRDGEFQMVNNLDPELFERVRSEMPAAARTLGASLDTEQMWFNQTPSAPLAAHKKAWFSSAGFRAAISRAIHREDLARVVYHGHAVPAAGPVSPANQYWFNQKLKPVPADPKAALARLAQEGFRLDGGVLKDKEGHAVEFSLITNAGNKSRERMASLIQQDLRAIGIQVNVVPLDFPSLIDRIVKTFQYEACLLGFVNTDLDPNGQMNVWLSSAANHPWNPNQKSPQTTWEAEIDRLMRAQAAELDPGKRKSAFDRVQQIAAEQEPLIYLVNREAMAAVSPQVKNLQPSVLFPQMLWNAERLYLDAPRDRAAK